MKIIGWKGKKVQKDLKKYCIYFIVNQMYMCLFNKKNGTLQIKSIPFKLKKFFDMSKSTKINPILQRNGEKSSHAYNYQRLTKKSIALG